MHLQNLISSDPRFIRISRCNSHHEYRSQSQERFMQLHIEGTLTTQDNHRHISHNFVVPEGATKLDLDFEYAPKRTEKYGNLLTLSLFDPRSDRGTGHRGQPQQHIMVSRAAASPGYLPGLLPEGTWDIMINCNLINDGPPINYQFDIAIRF